MLFSFKYFGVTITSSTLWFVGGLLLTISGNSQAADPIDVAGSAAQPNTVASCALPKIARITQVNESTQAGDITIVAKKTEVKKDQLAHFSGDVTLVSDHQKISAERIEFNRDNTEIKAQGHIHFQDNSIDVFASELSAGGTQTTTQMQQAAYQLASSNAHGSAQLLAVQKDGTLTLADSTFTTCPNKVPDWQLKASKITISAKNNFGSAHNVQFRLFDVPVFYLPYFTFPVTNQRKSGFLYPEISSSNNRGLEIKTPFYWNIANNVDATITPRYMSKRGLQLITQFRYLTGLQTGTVDVEYLPHDNQLISNNRSRYLARIQHTGTFSDHFRAYIDYTTTSDDHYLIDIGSKHYNANDTYLYQIGELSYFGKQWQSTLKVQDFEILGNHTPSYRTLPQLEFKRFQALPFYQAQLELNAELSRFETSDPNKPAADRYHLEAGIILPFSSPAWFFNSEFKLLQTNYYQKHIPIGSPLATKVSRTIPKIRFHGGLHLDRDIHAFGKTLTQTLEPQLQYLYVPDKYQGNIGLYDTTLLQDNFEGLFRDIRYSGLDRIAKANQYSWGVTSRLLNADNQELFRFSLGKIVYLHNSNIGVNQSQGIAADQSALAADLFMRFNDKWQFSSDIQYSTKEKFTNKSQASLAYRIKDRHLIQLNYRFSRNVSGVMIEQTSLLSSVTINKNWHLVGQVTQDLQQKRNLESYLGFQYESCCWAVRFAYHRSIDTNLGSSNVLSQNHNEFNNGFMIQFIIKGLTGNQSSVSTEDMFNSSIFGYKRPYFLNN